MPGRRVEDFLELVERARRGRLKLYLGFAAGVGKTCRMLEEAHALKARGVDVAVAFVETHGRVETDKLVTGLEVIPRRRLEYRGVLLEEMDLAAVLARQPSIAIVDELPHTNAPGSTHRKRWQDVLELLDHGINVIGALNVQHLESLGGLLERETGVVVRETIPDTLLRRADQIVNLDLAVEDLQERLRAGKIYPADKVPWALEHFFQAGNLTTLRELALREVAESLDRNSQAKAAAAPEAKLPSHRGERVMVAMSSNSPQGLTLLRRGSRIAGRLNTDWFVVYVETPGETALRIPADAQRVLAANLDKATELGAEVIRLQAKDPVVALLDFAHSHSVGHIVVGRAAKAGWTRFFTRSLIERLIDGAEGLDVHVTALEEK
jgi:two-component system sensor histidine kinase KdpD